MHPIESHLDYQADQIELVLSSHRLAGHILGGTVTPRWICYQFAPQPATRITRIAHLSEEIALRLGTDHVRVARQGPVVQIEVPRSDAQPVHLLTLTRQFEELPRQTALLGLDDTGSPLLLRLASPEVAHVLIAGTTGSGKTALARSMALSLAMYNRLGEIQMLFLDPKGTGFGPLANLPHLLRPIGCDVHHAIFLLGEMVSEMVRRDAEGISTPRLVIFIDEVADLMEQGGKAIHRLLTRLTQRGRSAGIHLVACTQKPLAAVIGSLTRSNFPVRLVGSVTSADDARTASGMPGTGAEKLLGRGDFLLVNKGRIIRFQAAYAADTDIQRVIAQWHGQHRTQRRWSDESLPATGTDGQAVQAPVKARRRPLEFLFGQQLRLIK